MTQDEIIRMAMEAGAVERYFGNQLHGIAFHKKEWLERFATLVAAHEREKHNSPSWETVDDAIAAEREACAKVCEQDMLGDNSRRDYERMNCAAAIRARNEK